MATLVWEQLRPSTTPTGDELKYLAVLGSYRLESIVETEPQSQSQAFHTLDLALQSSCKRSHRAIINSADRHSSLSGRLGSLVEAAGDLEAAMPALDHAAVNFSAAFAKTAGDSTSAMLGQRRTALLLSRNCERVVDVMGLPNLLEAVASSSASITTGANNSSALDLNAHIARLHALYPDSSLISTVSSDARSAMHIMAANLVTTLKQKNLKLAAAVRAVSWMRRILPELGGGLPSGSGTFLEREKCLVGLFLACRTATLFGMLSDLEPMRLLAEKEGQESEGQHTERYLKRYVEIFREQSFGILSMLKNLFPSAPAGDSDILRSPMSPISTFPLHLVDILSDTLMTYLGNVRSQALYDGLVTQIMYCSTSLGRLGGDFGIILGCLGPAMSGDKWLESIKRHKSLTKRFDSIVGAGGHKDSPPGTLSSPEYY